MDPWWNPALEQQAIDRVHRIGQAQQVTVYKIIIPNSVEERILCLQQRKQSQADEFLNTDELKREVERLSVKDLLYLFQIH